MAEAYDAGSVVGMDTVSRFVVDGRIVLMPTKRAKRLLVLDHVAQAFEPGRSYAEYEVNRVLLGFFDDYAALRRYLVDEGFLTREDNVYWRSGGSVEV
jgi:hypothetical protein